MGNTLRSGQGYSRKQQQPHLTMNSNISITDQLVDAIRTRNVVRLRALLSQQHLDQTTGRRRCCAAVTYDDIQVALYYAARDGCVVSCRVLWPRLCWRARKKYFTADKISCGYDVLHVAAEKGHLEVVRFFMEEECSNFVRFFMEEECSNFNINQKNYADRTPLSYATDSEEMTRFLLENGAHVNGDCIAFRNAVQQGNTEVVRLLFQYGADPNLPTNEEEDVRKRRHVRVINYAIRDGHTEIVLMLLEHGALVGQVLNDAVHNYYGTSLNYLLCQKFRTSRETKLSIASMLMDYAEEDDDTAVFMHASFEFAVNKQTDNDNAYQILLEAGMDPRVSMYCAIRAGNLSICQFLVREYQVDPVLEEEESTENDNNNYKAAAAAASPFLAAARLADTSIFECFLGHWDERFSSTNGGKNSDGDYPLHVVCCDPLVSLQAIQLLVDRQAAALMTVDGEEGLLPFHFAATWNASLDVIFYLLQHYPSALHQIGNSVVR